MAQDYYSDSNTSGDETSADTPAQDNSTDQTDTQDQEDSKDGESFLVSKSALSGHEPKVGDICKFKVESVLEDEVEFSYVKHDSNRNEPEENPDLDRANEDMESMAT